MYYVSKPCGECKNRLLLQMTNKVQRFKDFKRQIAFSKISLRFVLQQRLHIDERIDGKNQDDFVKRRYE